MPRRGDVALRPAAPADAAALTALAFRSKAGWGYDEAFLAACADELTVPPERCGPLLVVAEDDAGIVGYAELAGRPPSVELLGLFVEPHRQREGVGRLLFEDACRRARALGASTLVWDSDPHAETIYWRLGARTTGTAPSGSVAGRLLPRMELDLSHLQA